MQSLYLTHGGGGDHTYYCRNYPMEQMLDGYHVAAIMPSTPSRYKLANLKHAEQWFTFVSEELPEICNNMFNLSRDRMDTFAMGGSGGGYNSLKLGLRNPERFGVIAAMCPALLCQRFVEELIAKPDDPVRNQGGADFKALFGDQVPDEDDAFKFLEAAAMKGVKTKIFHTCGTEDWLYKINKDFFNRAKELDFNIEWDERPGGHTAEYGREMMPEFIRWLPLKRL